MPEYLPRLVALVLCGATLSHGQTGSVAPHLVATSAPVPTAPTPAPKPTLPAMPAVMWQPVQEYFTIVTPSAPGRQARQHEVNPFLSYTHIGSDFGFVGPAEGEIGWAPGMVWAQLPPSLDGWAGMWHSLARLARMPEETLDFTRIFPPWIEDRYQPRIVGLRARLSGRGDFKIEIKGPRQENLWLKSWHIDSPQEITLAEPLQPENFRAAKLLNWIAEPGANLMVDSLGFDVAPPKDVPFDWWVFASAYAKASRCYSPATGLVRDRAHTEDGAFDSIPATGLFLLATSAAAKTGMVSEEWAQGTLRKSWTTVSAMAGPNGLLPHFSRRVEGGFAIHPGTEYSTVDTALYYQGTLVAAVMLGNHDLADEVRAAIRRTRFDTLRDAEGYVSHGIRDDGKTVIPFIWRDWGGETALVLMLQAMASDGLLPPKMARNGRVHQGTGFIGEIQSLFYPDFDRPEPDAVTGINWREARRELLRAQRAYFVNDQPADGYARLHGLYGLSAGESAYGLGYFVGGVDLPNQRLLHPHYILMAAASEDEPNAVYQTLAKLQALDLFPPFGLVENVFADGTEHLPLQGGLNATFEAVSAYHLLARSRGMENAIYKAAGECQDLRRAVQIFYPDRSPATQAVQAVPAHPSAPR